MLASGLESYSIKPMSAKPKNPEAGEVRVDVGNDVSDEHEDVQLTMAGLAYTIGALISVGNVDLVTKEGAGFETLFPRINNAITKSWDEVVAKHPAMTDVIGDLEAVSQTGQFARFIESFCALDVLYHLSPDEADPNHHRFSIVPYN